LATDSQSGPEAMEHYRKGRDKINFLWKNLPEILKQKKENIIFDQARFVAELKSVLGQMPEHIKSTKKS